MKRLISLAIMLLMVAGMGLSLFHVEPVKAGSTSVAYAFGGAPAMNPIVKPIAKAGGYQISFTYMVSETIPSPCTAPSGCTYAAPNGPGLSITIPNDFPAPSLDPNSPGYITSTTGTVYVYNRTAVVYFPAMAVGSAVTFQYGRLGPDNPLVMPSRPNNYTFTMALRTSGRSNAITTDMPYPSSFTPVTLSPVVKVLSNMTPATVIFNPNTEKQNAECEVTFAIGAGEERSLTKGDKIRIWFDIDPANGQTLPAFVLPNEATQVPLAMPADSITVNGMKCTTTPSIQYLADVGAATALVDVVVPQDIRSSATSGTVIKVKFAKTAGIYTGRGTPYQRTVKVATMNASGTNLIEPIPDNYDNYPETLTSPPYPNCFLTGNAYRIGTSVTAPTVQVVPSTVSTEAQYTIGLFPCGAAGSLQIGATGALYANDGTISIEFPAGTVVPAKISPGSITISINGGTPSILSQEPVVSGTRISFKTPVNINGGDCISIAFTQSAHLANPSVGADNYYLKIWTSAEPTIINSGNYSITNPGYAVVNVDPNISFTSLLNPPACAPPPPVYAAPYECYRYANNDCDPTGARYTIQFSLNEACPLTVGSLIYVTFDPDYIGIVPNPTIPGNLIMVNNSICTTPAQIQPDGRTYAIFSPVTLPIKSQVTIAFLPGAGIQNPDVVEEAESYAVSIRIPCPPNPDYTIVSQPYFIKTELSNIQLVPNWNDDTSATWNTTYPYQFKPAVNTITGWRFDFCVGDYGDRATNRPNIAGGDTITIVFPEGTTLPTTAITNGVIRLGIHDENTLGLPIGTAITWPRVDNLSDFGLENVIVDGNKITMTVPSSVFVNENAKLTVFFPESLGIRTPKNAGAYVAIMWTSKEQTPVMSGPFTIGTVVQDIGVTVTPNTSQSVDENCVSGTSEITVRFRNGLSGTLVPGNFIYIVFPSGFQHSTGIMPAGTVILNGISNSAPLVGPIGNIGNFAYAIPVQDYIAPGSLIEVTFLRDALIKNPRLTQTPMIFTLTLYTTSEPAPVKSTPFELVSKVCMSCSSSPDFHSVHFWDLATGTFAKTSILMGSSGGVDGGGWLIGFRTGDVGAIVHDITKVTVEFPERTGVPSYIAPDYVRCSTTAPWSTLCGAAAGTPARSIQVEGQKVTIVFPIDVPAGFNAYIYFCEEASIIAPDRAGETRIKLSTSAEPTAVESCPFLVEPRGMSPAIVTPYPSQAGAPNVQYTIEFTLGMYGTLNVGDMINVDFIETNATQITQIDNPQFSANKIPPMYVTVNDMQCIIPIAYEPPVAATSSFKLHIQTPVSVLGNSRVKIVLSPQCRILNPTVWSPEPYNTPLPPNYMVRISTNKEVRPVDSEEYEITNPSAPTRPIVLNDPCVANLPAIYSMSFVTPLALTFNQTTPPMSSYIDITFPEGFYLPSTMSAASVRINEYLCVVSPIISNYSVRVYVPTNINAWDKVNIKFDPNLMLYNPAVAGTYNVTVSLNGGPSISGKYTVCEQINICRVEIVPGGQSSIPIGGTQVFQAKVFDCQGRVIENNLEINWTFSSDAGYISPIKGPSTTFTAFKKGEGVLMAAATYGNRTMTSTVPIIVTGLPSSLLINPQGPATLIKGQCYPYSAQLFDDYSTPHPISNNVTYEWELSSANLGTVIPSSGKSTQFCPSIEGRGYVICKATYEGTTFTARSEFIVKSGIFTLFPIPASDLGQFKVGQVSPELMFELRDENGAPKESPDTKSIVVETTSPTGMFSVDKLHWTIGTKITVSITQGFSRSTSFYYVDPGQGNVLLSGVTENVNPAYIKINYNGSSSRLRFTNETRVTSAGTPSGALTLSVRDEYNQPMPPPSDTLITINAYPIINGVVQPNPSTTGAFSASSTAWMALTDNTLTMRSGQQSIDVFYKDSVMGTYQIKARSMVYGTDIQSLIVTQAGSVGGNLTVVVDRPIALIPSDYHISVRVGSSGQLQAGLGHIYVQFPKGTELPTFGQADIKVNTAPTSIIPIVDRVTNILDIVSPVNVNANGDVMLDIPRVVNPPEGTYTVKVWTSAESSPATSQPYIIGQSSVTNVTATPTPNSAGIPAQYIIKFRTGPSGTLNKNDDITVEFPVGTSLPTKIDAKYIKIHGLECTTAPIITGLQVKFFNTMPVGPDTEWDIIVDINAGITNPPVPKNDYKIRLSTKPEPKLVDSTPYEITLATTITEFVVKTAPPTVSEKARWELTFKLGANGALLPGDEIFVQMNDEILPASIAADYVSINGVKPATDVSIDGKRLKFRIKSGVAAGQQVIITIDANAGVRNPEKPGSEYRLSVFTTKEPYAVLSDPFTVESSVVVTYSLNPAAPNGKHNWYTVPVSISLESNVAGDISWQYEGEAWQNYTTPFFVNKTGQSVIYAKSKSKSTGTESAAKRIVIKYDPNPPKITIVSPADGSQVKDQVVNLAGNVTESESGDVTLTMNGEGIAVNGTTFTKQVVLKNGLNTFSFQAEDAAGNSTSYTYKIELKNQPPLLVVEKPGFLDVVSKVELVDVGQNKKQLNASLDISGYSEVGVTSVKVTPVTVPGSSQTIPVGADGKFSGTLKFPAVGGQNEFDLEITDKLGNVATKKVFVKVQIKFVTQINNSVASLNGSQFQLQSAPYIDKGRTLVPFRILGESFGANVEWDANTKTAIYTLGNTRIELVINSKQAKIITNGVSKIVTMDVPAIIKSGSTMVPIRFVTENFGAKVTWTQATKTVTVDYPAL